MLPDPDESIMGGDGVGVGNGDGVGDDGDDGVGGTGAFGAVVAVDVGDGPILVDTAVPLESNQNESRHSVLEDVLTKLLDAASSGATSCDASNTTTAPLLKQPSGKVPIRSESVAFEDGIGSHDCRLGEAGKRTIQECAARMSPLSTFAPLLMVLQH